MRFFDHLFNRSAQNADRAPTERIANPTLDFIKQVWDAPALYNRHTRRAVGLLSKVWRWDTNVEGMRRTFVPRYVRRHAAALTVHKTRRQRRHYARILRAAERGGIRL